ncbi:MAG TPA: hypothetical protein VMV05_11820 [bacterium]|nr:hypothetical protein [bacterium]
MNKTLKGFLFFLVTCAGLWGQADAGQQLYLSESPNGRYRVIIEQNLDRRVADKVFFRYSVDLVNTHNPSHHFEILQGGSPLVQETDKGTFQVKGEPDSDLNPETTPVAKDMFDDHWASIRFSWSADSLKLFIRLETIEGTWKTYFVDINSGKTRDITADLEQAMVAKFDARNWDCQEPEVRLIKWIEPHLAFFKLTTACGKSREKENDKLFRWKESVLFDTNKGRSVLGLDNSYDEKAATAKFQKYYQGTIPTPTPLPTPTPTPEETPTGQ